MWCYGFHHEEAEVCFQRAADADLGCAMAYWGLALVIGPDYNKRWDEFDPIDLGQAVPRAFAASQKAMQLAASASPLERALIQALSLRYQGNAPTDELESWIDDYADAMREVYATYPDHFDVVTLFADALLNRTPWKLWDLKTGTVAEGADTLEAKGVLERAMSQMEDQALPWHVGVLHMYIHVMEMSPTPELALKAADRIVGLVPDAGHIDHMASHIYILCGLYQDVIRVNSMAIDADRKYLRSAGPNNFYTSYRIHDYHFKAYGAMFLGQYRPAIEAATELADTVPEAFLRIESPPMADWNEAYLTVKHHVLIRFGKWQEILDLPLPADPVLYSMTTAVTHYAKGVAYAATGRIEQAEAEQALFEAATGRVQETRKLFNNTCENILNVAREMLSGEIQYRRGNFDDAFAHLRKSVELDDNLPYNEPWGWMQPTRHALGALLLEQDRVAEAEAVYRADLGLDSSLPRPCQHPDNVWALHGYHECLVKQNRRVEAALVTPRLEAAQARADAPIAVSCFCRLSHG
jgi:tetratricopeptide (TPR) repeat protein